MLLPIYIFKQLSMASEVMMGFQHPQEERNCQAEVSFTAQSCPVLRGLISHRPITVFWGPPLSGTHFLVQFLMCRKVAKIRDCTKHLCLAFLVFSLFYLSCSPQVLWTPVMKHLESEYSCCLPNVEMLNPYLCWSSSSVCDGRAF